MEPGAESSAECCPRCTELAPPPAPPEIVRKTVASTLESSRGYSAGHSEVWASWDPGRRVRRDPRAPGVCAAWGIRALGLRGGAPAVPAAAGDRLGRRWGRRRDPLGSAAAADENSSGGGGRSPALCTTALRRSPRCCGSHGDDVSGCGRDSREMLRLRQRDVRGSNRWQTEVRGQDGPLSRASESGAGEEMVEAPSAVAI